MSENDRQIILTESQLRLIIKETVHDTFISLGIQDAQPIEMQKDFQLLREWRTSTEGIKRKGLIAFAALIFSGLSALIIIGLKEYL